MRIAEQVAHWLARHGVEQAFTVTGGGAMFLNQAIGGHEELRCSFLHHEQACAMAAEGYARVAGKPAVVMLTTGPGAINAFNGVFGAYTDSVPMIVLSGQVKRETCRDFREVGALRQLGDQEGPTIAMAQHICKYTRLIREPADLVWALPEAYRQAVSGRPGPVWLDIPLDVQSSTELLDIPAPFDAGSAAQDPAAAAALLADADAVLERLRQSQRPLILGGTGVRLAGAVEALLAWAERNGIPLATAWTHDLIASDHPLFAGRPGTIGTRAGNFCLQNADFVLVLGSRLNIRQTSYNWDSFANGAYVAQVDIDPLELRKPMVVPDLAITADVAQFVAALQSRQDAGATLPSYRPWAAWCRAIGARYRVADEHRQLPGAPLNPYLVVERIFAQARPDDIFVSGNASACILPFQIGALQAGQRLFSNSGSASMGYDLPAALGAAIAAPSRRVICFAGDGSLQMNIQELQSLKTLGLNLVIIVLNNEGYLSIRQTHENFFGRVIGANPASGVDFPPFEAVARAYGIAAATIDSEAQLPALDALLAADGPQLIDIRVDPQQEFTPRIKSRVDQDGKFLTPALDDMFPFLDPQIVQQVRQSALDLDHKEQP
ncbi:thiamine pyrophosphate-binding protein [Oxalobacteraceae bacterium A2-2]